MRHEVTCKCGEVLLKSQNSTLKIRGKVFMIKEDGQAYTVCKSCGSEVQMPLELKKAVQPSLFIRNTKESS